MAGKHRPPKIAIMPVAIADFCRKNAYKNIKKGRLWRPPAVG